MLTPVLSQAARLALPATACPWAAVIVSALAVAAVAMSDGEVHINIG